MSTKEQSREMLGKRIRKLRERHQDKQEDLAEKMYVTRQTVSKWELGKTRPDAANLAKLSELYEVSIAYLLDGEKEETEEKEHEDESGKETRSLESAERHMEVWEDDEKLRKILLSCAGVVAMAAMAWMRIPPIGMIVCVSWLVYSRKWKVNTKWMDCLTTVYLLLDTYRFYIFLNHWIVDFGRSTFHFYH